MFYWMVGDRHIYRMHLPLDVIPHAKVTQLKGDQMIAYRCRRPLTILDYQLANKLHIIILTTRTVEVIDQFSNIRLSKYDFLKDQRIEHLLLAPLFDLYTLPCVFNVKENETTWPLVDI
jgi:hypothetical protein